MRWQQLTTAIEDFQAIRGKTIEMADEFSDEQAVKCARTGAWSAAEVLDHILRAEVVFRNYERQALERAQAGETGTIRISFREVDTRLRPVPSRLMPLLTPVLFALHAVTPFAVRLFVMRRPGLVWADAPKIAQPIAGRGMAELRGNLAAEMHETVALFEGRLPKALRRVRAAHPLYGFNDMAQVMRLMGAHEQRHQHQLRAILRRQ